MDATDRPDEITRPIKLLRSWPRIPPEGRAQYERRRNTLQVAVALLVIRILHCFWVENRRVWDIFRIIMGSLSDKRKRLSEFASIKNSDNLFEKLFWDAALRAWFFAAKHLILGKNKG